MVGMGELEGWCLAGQRSFIGIEEGTHSKHTISGLCFTSKVPVHMRCFPPTGKEKSKDGILGCKQQLLRDLSQLRHKSSLALPDVGCASQKS